MDKSVSKNRNLKYVEKLEPVARKRYYEKLKLIDNFDPYDNVGAKQWTNEYEKLPGCSYPDIVNYLVFATSFYTLDQMGAYKSLEAYKQLVAGWVGDIRLRVFGGNTVATCKVMHSQSLSDKPPQPWVITENEGKVLTAHCNCMAGLGEACTHVGSLLFKIETAVRIRETKTVTQEKAYWLLPGFKGGVNYARISDIDFTSAKTKKRILDQKIDQSGRPSQSIQPSPVTKKRSNAIPPTEDELKGFFSDLSKCETNPAILSLISPYSDSYIPAAMKPEFPPLLTGLYKEENEGMDYNKLVEYCETIDISVNSQQIQAVEEAARNQSDSKTWFRFRAGRVTASKFKAVCRTSATNPAKSLTKSICYPEQFRFKSAATQRGCEHEDTARKQYMFEKSRQGHDNLQFSPAGFVISEDFPFIGASPDGFESCDCCGDGCYEIKCPYCFKQEKISEKQEKISDINDKKFCLQPDLSGVKRLDSDHQYFFQAQCQIFSCKKEFCDFVVWTEEDIHIECIEPDDEFWESASLIAKRFFTTSLLPELTGKFYSRQLVHISSPKQPEQTAACSHVSKHANVLTPLHGLSPKSDKETPGCYSNTCTEKKSITDEETWCLCNQPEEGDMIACNNVQLNGFTFNVLELRKKSGTVLTVNQTFKGNEQIRIN